MYSTCTFCYAALGSNDVIATFPVARRIAFDPAKGCIWAVCPHCAAWNLAPLTERWEAAEECERRFRTTSLRYTSGNIGLAWLGGDIDLVRIGAALRPEVAAWRYGRTLLTRKRTSRRFLVRVASLVASGAERLVANERARRPDARAALANLIVRLRGRSVLDVLPMPLVADGDAGSLAVVRLQHLLGAALVRPEAGHGWSLLIPHDHGVLKVEGDEGIRMAARFLSVINRTQGADGFARDVLEAAVRKVDESAFEDSYFNRVLTIALRSDWGRGPGRAPDETGPLAVSTVERVHSDVERLAFRLTGRTFWGRGGIGSDPSTLLLQIPLVDRLALEIAAHEETERRSLEGELAELEASWRDAAEIAEIADALLDD